MGRVTSNAIWYVSLPWTSMKHQGYQYTVFMLQLCTDINYIDKEK